MANNRISTPDNYQLELLTQLRERRAIRAHRPELIRAQATCIMRTACLVVALYSHGVQGASLEFIWISEFALRGLIFEMMALPAEEEIDQQVEEEMWAQIN